MLPRPVGFAFLAGTAFLVCSCSRNDNSQQARSDESSSGPNVAPSAAPGVAFNYSYDFNLPDKRISATQEAHAAACERLGIGRCRITGMSYSIDQEDRVTAELDLKVDASIAREFGKSAQQAVSNNDGKLVHLEIGSSDEGATIDVAARQKADASAQLSRLQQELAKTKPGTQAHTDLLSRIGSLQDQQAQQTHTIENSQAAVATTPMAFHYYGQGGVPGFRGNPVREAWHTLVTTVVWLTGILLQAAAVLIPVAILLGLFIGLWRTRPMRALRRWIRGPEEAEA
jgi:hypothetical protein